MSMALKKSDERMLERRRQQTQETENVRVVCRLRPLLPHELEAGAQDAIQVGADSKSVHVHVPEDEPQPRRTEFKLDEVLDGSFDQEATFEHSGVKGLLDSALEGFSATVFAYGQTGSGKTYTMAGQDADAASYHPACFDGVIPRAVRYIFEQVEERRATAKYTIRASFLEIYNEQVRDLWNTQLGALQIREYPPGYWRGFYVEDLYIFECDCFEDMMLMLWEGMRQRAVGAHNLNKDSSRSHSMLTFYLESEEMIDDEPCVKFGKIAFVDLAGTERLKDTQNGERPSTSTAFKSKAAMKSDEMLKETGSINQSLFTLGKVISALGDSKTKGPKYVPYRDSKLTKLLMDTLGGSSKALMFACCSPADNFMEETLSTLSYAMRARNIVNKPSVQLDPHEELVRELKAENKECKETMALLAQALRECASAEPGSAEIARIIAAVPTDALLFGENGKMTLGGGGGGGVANGSRRAGSAGGRSTRPTSSSSMRIMDSTSDGSNAASSRPWSVSSSSSSDAGSRKQEHANSSTKAAAELYRGKSPGSLRQDQRQTSKTVADAAAASLINSVPQGRRRQRRRSEGVSQQRLSQSAEGISGHRVASSNRRPPGAQTRTKSSANASDSNTTSSDGSRRGVNAGVSQSADWDRGSWESYRLNDLDESSATGVSSGYSCDFPSRPPRGAAAAARAAGTTMPFSSPSIVSDTASDTTSLPSEPPSARWAPGTATGGFTTSREAENVPSRGEVHQNVEQLKRGRGVERELKDWEQWKDLVDSIEDGKSTPKLGQHQSRTAPSQSRGVVRTSSGSSGGTAIDWRACLSPSSSERVSVLEATRDAVGSSVEKMSAAMKELQQIERKATTTVTASGSARYAGDALETWVQNESTAANSAH